MVARTHGTSEDRNMMESIPLDGPIDLAALDDFLASDRTPPDCMQLSEFDGFLAGIVAGPPRMIPPSIWLPMIWHGDEPDYADIDEMQAILGTIMRRHNEIIRVLDTAPDEFRLVLVAQDDGSFDASDWTLGFLRAIALCQDEWEPLLRDRLAGALIVPIMLIASTTDRANLPLDADERMPDAEMAKLLAGAPQLLALSVAGIRVFFQNRSNRPRRKGASHTSRARRG
jgi:uncharacterized protein